MSDPAPGSDADGAQPETAAVQCYGDTCITCSDEALPVVLLELLPSDMALADTGSGVEEVSVALVEAGVGDTVLVHAREAIAVLPRTAADRVPAGGDPR